MAESTTQNTPQGIWMSIEEAVVQEFLERMKAAGTLSDESLEQLRESFGSKNITQESLLKILQLSAENGPEDQAD